jgi:hypothetical protein
MDAATLRKRRHGGSERCLEASGSAEAERVAGEAADGDVSAAGTGDAAKVAKKSPIFSCLPLDVYMDWLASNLVGLAGGGRGVEQYVNG